MLGSCASIKHYVVLRIGYFQTTVLFYIVTYNTPAGLIVIIRSKLTHSSKR